MSTDNPDSTDKDLREAQRVGFSARVRLKMAGAEQLVQYLTENLSADGLFIKTDKPLERGREIQIQVVDEGGGELFVAVGRVMWIRTAAPDSDMPSGMGLKFLSLNDRSRVTVERLLAASQKLRSRRIVQDDEGMEPVADIVEPPLEKSLPVPLAPPSVEEQAALDVVHADAAPASEESPVVHAEAAHVPEEPPVVHATARPSSIPHRPAAPGRKVGRRRVRVGRGVWIAIGLGVIALIAAGGITAQLLGRRNRKAAYAEALNEHAATAETQVAALAEGEAAFDSRRATIRKETRSLRKTQRGLALSRQETLRMKRTMRALIPKSRSRFKLSQMSKPAYGPKETLREVSYDMEVFGDVRNLKALFKAMYGHRKAMRVDSIEVNLLSFNTTQCRVNARVSFFEYSRAKPLTAAGAVSADYLAATAPVSVNEEWEGLGGKNVDAALSRVEAAQSMLASRREVAVVDQSIRVQEQALRTWGVDIEMLLATRDAGRLEVVALAPRLREAALESSDAVATAKIDRQGHLSLF